MILFVWFKLIILAVNDTQMKASSHSLSSAVLSAGNTEQNKTEEELGKCGYSFCLADSPSTDANSTTSTNSTDGIPDWQRYTMASIYLIFALLSSLIILLFVDPLIRYPIHFVMVAAAKHPLIKTKKTVSVNCCGDGMVMRSGCMKESGGEEKNERTEGQGRGGRGQKLVVMTYQSSQSH